MRFFPFFLLFWRINSKKKNRKWYIGVFRGNWNCITCESCVNYRLENRRFSESRRLPHRFSGSPDCVTAGDHVTPQVCQTFFRKRERPVSQNYTKSPAVKRPFSKFPSPPRLSLSLASTILNSLEVEVLLRTRRCYATTETYVFMPEDKPRIRYARYISN